MNRSVFGLASLALGTCLPWGLHAQSMGFHGAMALGSQLVDRGQPITAETPILQAAASWTSPTGWSLGLSAGAPLRTPGQLAEASVQASRYWPLSDAWQMQTGLLYYRHPGSPRTRAFDRAEAGIQWMYRDVLTFGLSAVRVLGRNDHRLRGAADVDFHWPLPGHFYLSAGAGVAQTSAAPYRAYAYTGSYHERYDRESPSSYRYGHLGLIWAMGDWRAELDRVVTTPRARWQHGAPSLAPWVATVSWSF
ncbi:MAG: hypothetical protein HOQ10_03190 [Frateuria sp.]|uniref:hypothetical protein n=1 Tax=Frateuria sp. TaxID=2211372 RepID=UPI0017D6F891|nr:hypothetical protein [Frateuria sp.]NUO71705.1 hypothetical protein [Frateuria sp.]NUR21598.1 hypothetical protein [Frateuria sp.]